LTQIVSDSAQISSDRSGKVQRRPPAAPPDTRDAPIDRQGHADRTAVGDRGDHWTEAGSACSSRKPIAGIQFLGASRRFTINANGTVKKKCDVKPPMITTGS